MQCRQICLDPVTGEVRWTGPPRVGKNVMFLSVPGYVLALIDSGEARTVNQRLPKHGRCESYQISLHHAEW